MSGIVTPTNAFSKASSVPDEVLKRELHGGVASDRSNGAYHNRLPDTVKLQQQLEQHYRQPTVEDVQAPEVQDLLRCGKLSLVVPMKENGPAIAPLLKTATKQLSPDAILVVNDKSDDDALYAVRKHAGVRLVYADDVHAAIDWPALLEVLNLRERPSGKGVAVLCGYLCQYALASISDSHPEYLVQHDAEIADYERYQALRYLAWAVLSEPKAHYAKIAKFGRGNDRCMAIRSTLLTVANLADQAHGGESAEGRRARDLFHKLVPHKWMLTGEFACEWSLAMHRPFATGYLEETLTSIVAEDRGEIYGKHTVHVANPNPRLDAPNDDRKEAAMQQQIGNFCIMLASQPATTHWSVTDIANLNRRVMDDPIVMGWIPPDDTPVIGEVLPNDRIIPSVEMMVEEKLFEVNKLCDLLKKH